MASSPDVEESGTTTKWLKYRLKHKWTLEDFSLFYLEGKKSPRKRYIFSQPFACAEDGRLAFQLYLYPQGNMPENAEHLSIFLKGPAKQTVKFTLSILNGRNEKLFSQNFTHIFPTKGKSFGWSKFIEQKVLLDASKGFLPEDTLTLLGEVDLYQETTFQQSSQILQLESLKRRAIEENSRLYGNLLESGHLSDAVLVVGGPSPAGSTEILPVHRSILAAHSPVFKAMFDCPMSESQDGRVVIDDLPGDALKKLIEFIYTGKAEFSDELAEELLQAADKYGVEKLKNICGQYLCGKVNLDTVICLFILADRHSVDNLKKTTIKFIRQNMTQMVLADTWPLVDKLVIEELRKQDAEKRKEKTKISSLQSVQKWTSELFFNRANSIFSVNFYDFWSN